MSTSLFLAFLNNLPLPRLDGHSILSDLLSTLSTGSRLDLENSPSTYPRSDSSWLGRSLERLSGSALGRSVGRRRDGLEKGIVGFSVGLAGFAVGVTVLVELLSLYM
jgi:membrane-associated protease RseP (regulator of RpoE activity)